MHSLLQDFDRGVATQVAQLPSWTTPLMTACSFMGLPVVVVSASLMIAAVCYMQGLKSVAYAFMASAAALGANSIVKLIFRRLRPETMYVESMAIKSYSFPSGHAFGSMVFYGLIAYLCYQHVAKPFNIVGALLLAFLIIAIGVSRVSLGAHFPSDVLVGWLLGGVALVLIIKAFGL